MGGICSCESSNTDDEDDSEYPGKRRRVKSFGKQTKGAPSLSNVDDYEMVPPKRDPPKLPLSFSGELNPSPAASTASTKVNLDHFTLLGATNELNFGKDWHWWTGRAVEVIDTLRSSMSNLNISSGVVYGMTSRKNKISILAFEVANTIVKGANLLQSLSKGNIQFLKKEILHSEGVQQLITTDLEELLSIAAADKREEFDVLSREVIRFGNLCKDPRWHNLDLYFQKLDSETSTHGQIKEEVERTMQELATLALNTAELYHELHALDRFEKDYRSKLEELESLHITQSGENLLTLQSELKHQRKLVKSLEKKSLWSKNLEEVMGNLVDIVTFIHQEIIEAFGHNGKELIRKDAFQKSERLGVCGLALHYSNIITQIDSIVARPSFLPPNARDTLYHALPPNVKIALRSRLRLFQAKEELTIAQIKDELEKILRWLVPVAANTTKAHKTFGWVGEWASTSCEFKRTSDGSYEFNKRTSAPNNLLRLQTFYHADKEKTDQCIIELVTWLHRLISHVRPRDYGFKPLLPVRSPTRNALLLRPGIQRSSLQVHKNAKFNSKALLLSPETRRSSSPLHNSGKINGKTWLLQPETPQSSSSLQSNGNINGEALLLQFKTHPNSYTVKNNVHLNSKVSLQLLRPETQQCSSPVNDDGKTNSKALLQHLQFESQQSFSPVHKYSETNIRTPLLQPESQQGSPLLPNIGKNNKAVQFSQEDRDMLEKIKWRKLVPRKSKSHEFGAGKKKKMKQDLRLTKSTGNSPMSSVHLKTLRLPGLQLLT